MKIKYIFIMFIVIAISITTYIYNVYPYYGDIADENFNKYIHKQGISKENILKINKAKPFELNEIIYRVIYKDDPELEYEYIYSKCYNEEPFNIVLIVYHNNNSVDSEGIIPKHPEL